jgi:flagellar biogenesis protein FliO
MDLIQPLAAIVLVAALLGGALFLLKKRGGAPLPGLRRLEVIERVSLGPQHALHLVRAGDRLVLIATAPSSCQVLDYGEKS